MPDKISWYPDEIIFLKRNFFSLTNQQLLDYINNYRAVKLKISSVRHQCYRMGLKRGIQIRWSDEDTNYLKKHYRKFGDTELAIRFNKRKKTFRIIKGKRMYRKFTKKHVEKKRKLLGLSRDQENIRVICQRNKDIGLTTGYFTSKDNQWSRGQRIALREGETIIQRKKNLHQKMIKVDSKLIPYHRWSYINFIGPVNSNEYVKFKDLDATNCLPDNLYLSTNKIISKEHRLDGISLLNARIEKLIKKIRYLNDIDRRAIEPGIIKEIAKLRSIKKHYSGSRKFNINEGVVI